MRAESSMPGLYLSDVRTNTPLGSPEAAGKETVRDGATGVGRGRVAGEATRTILVRLPIGVQVRTQCRGRLEDLVEKEAPHQDGGDAEGSHWPRDGHRARGCVVGSGRRDRRCAQGRLFWYSRREAINGPWGTESRALSMASCFRLGQVVVVGIEAGNFGTSDARWTPQSGARGDVGRVLVKRGVS